jgi:F0F1-type ATP synthase delta subunit
MNQFDLTPFCRTQDEGRDFAAKLATLAEHVYRTDFAFEETLSAIFGLQKKAAVIKLMRESKTAFTTPADLKNFLTALSQQVTSLPVVSLTLAFTPTDATLTLLSGWFLRNTKQQMLFAITVDPTLIAGVALRYNGRYVEYSIKPTMQRIITEKLTAPTPSMRPVTPTPPVHHAIESMSLGR